MKAIRPKQSTIIDAVAVITTIVILIACSKSSNKNNNSGDGSVTSRVETGNSITYKVYVATGRSSYKGILVMGSGNDESNPSPGSLDGGPENDLCQTAASNGYVAAIVQYRAGKPLGPNGEGWDDNARQLGIDYNNCIGALSTKYGVDKSKSVVGGYSYASYMLFTINASFDDLNYCKGILGACGATDPMSAPNFRIPIFAISCAGTDEDAYNAAGKNLYDKIPANSPIKSQSEGITDNSCSTHCGGAGGWTDKMYKKLTQWLQ